MASIALEIFYLLTQPHRHFSVITTFLVASAALAAAAPAPSVNARDIFRLEKRCSVIDQACDGINIRCCAGMCCTGGSGSNHYLCEAC
jgi:hypothetical protein